MKRANSKNFKNSSSAPTKAGGKVVPMATPKSTKTADNTTKRLAKPIKAGGKING